MCIQKTSLKMYLSTCLKIYLTTPVPKSTATVHASRIYLDHLPVQKALLIKSTSGTHSTASGVTRCLKLLNCTSQICCSLCTPLTPPLRLCYGMVIKSCHLRGSSRTNPWAPCFSALRSMSLYPAWHRSSRFSFWMTAPWEVTLMTYSNC